MSSEDDQDEEPKKRKRNRHKRRQPKKKSANARLVVKDLLSGCDWLQDTLCFWQGRPDNSMRQPFSAWQLMEDALLSQPAGLYALCVVQDTRAFSEMEPHLRTIQVTRVIHINPLLLAHTTMNLDRLDSRLGQLKRHTDNPKAWLAAQREQLKEAELSLRGAEVVMGSGPPHMALWLEATTLWVGARHNQASSTLDVAELKLGLAAGARLRRIAQVVVGQRRMHLQGYRATRWTRVGALLNTWPVQAVARIPEAALRGVIAIIEQHPALNERAVGEALLAATPLSGFSGSQTLTFLTETVPLLMTLERMTLERDVRKARLLRLINNLFAEQTLPVLRPDSDRQWEERPLQYAWDILAGLHQADPEMVDELGVTKVASVETLFAGLLGTPLPASAVKKLPVLQRGTYGENFLARVESTWKEVLRDTSLPFDRQEYERGKNAFLELLARLAMCSGRKGTGTAMAKWLDACRVYCPPGASGHDAMAVALDGLWRCFWNEHAIMNLRRLSDWGPDLLAACQRGKHCRRPENLTTWRGNVRGVAWLLSELCAQTDEDAYRLIQPDCRELAAVANLREPQNLHLLAQWLRAAEGALSTQMMNSWLPLFSIEDTKVVEALKSELITLKSRYYKHWMPCTLLAVGIGHFLADHKAPDKQERRNFVLSHMNELRKILVEVSKRYPVCTDELDDESMELIRWAIVGRRGILQVIWAWHQAGFSDIPGLVDRLLAECDKNEDMEAKAGKQGALCEYLLDVDRTHLPMLVGLSGGDVSQLVVLLEKRPSYSPYPVSYEDAWKMLATQPRVVELLTETVRESTVIERLLKQIPRLGLASRLMKDGDMQELLRQWTEPASNDYVLSFEPYEEDLEKLSKLAGWRKMAGCIRTLPRKVRDIDEMLIKDQRSLAVLESQSGHTSHQLARMSTLRYRLGDLEAFAVAQAQELKNKLPNVLVHARLDALDQLINQALGVYWEKVLPGWHHRQDDPLWDNALSFLHCLPKPDAECRQGPNNRRILKLMLRRIVEGQEAWPLQHPDNTKYLRRLKYRGFSQVDAWLEPHETQVYASNTKAGLESTVLAIRAETNPLHVLMMGVYFKTCLGMGGMNSFAAVANAVEVNKRVLYLYNSKGKPVGRKLLVLTEDGVVTGFNSYGTGAISRAPQAISGNPWVKIGLDLASRELADKAGLKLAKRADLEKLEGGKHAEDAPNLTKELAIFAEWYFDGFEEFDWWMVQPEGPTHENRELLLEGMLAKVREVREQKYQAQFVRCMLWAGSAAVPYVATLAESPEFGAPSTRLIWLKLVAFSGSHHDLRAAAGRKQAELDLLTD